jgi:hypothetical protein
MYKVKTYSLLRYDGLEAYKQKSLYMFVYFRIIK